MRKIGHLDHPTADTLRDSLGAIRRAQIQLRHLTCTHTSPTALASQIELYKVLLAEISDIRSSLAEDIKQTRAPPPANGHRGLSP